MPLKRLALSVSLLLPLIASCQGTYPISPTQAEFDAAAIATSAAIKRGEVGNAISGTVELPINLRAFASITDGAPPVTIHVFRTTGQLIREATISVFWRDDRSISYVVDGVPADHTVVLAATIEPGIVLRSLVPKSSREHPTRGQTINTISETVVIEAYLSGLMPPVGLGGTAEVLLQGGLNPAAAALANTKAQEALAQFAVTEWGKGVSEASATSSALKALSDAQAKVANAVNAGTTDHQQLRTMARDVFQASLAAKQLLGALRSQVDERAKQGEPPHDAAGALNVAAAALQEAANTDVPAATAVLSAPGTFHIAQLPPGLVLKSPFPYKETKPSQVNLGALYQQLNYLATADADFKGPNGGPFTQAEIDDALENGKGPYRTSCSQIWFSGERNCTVVTNPADKSREVLITRQADLLETKLLKLEEAYAANDEAKVREVLKSHPALLNYIVDDKARWTSPIGTWRLRLLQDTGESLWGGAGWPVLSDAEMYIAASKIEAIDATAVSSGEFRGLISIWMPNAFTSPSDVLNNFSMRFDWDDQDKTLMEGEIRGERRETSGDTVYRTDYSASFEGRMVEGSRIRGFWFNDERDMAGRFEMIRGTARYSI